MSERINDGGPAFPCVTIPGQQFPDGSYVGKRITEGGMTIRDYFAAAALTGALADGRLAINQCEVGAEHAFAMADAMLAARGKEQA